MDTDDDVALVRKARAGDPRAFEALVARHERVVFNVALRMVGEREDARDVAQTTFLKAYRHLDRFDEQRRFFSWIYRITVNEALHLLSRRRGQEPISDSMVSPERSPEEQLGSDDVGRVVQEALQALAPADREVIVLRHLLQRSHEEMSEALGVPEKTVKSRLFTARRRLTEVLRKRGVTPT